MQRVIDQLSKFFIILVCMAFSFFIYANIVEQIFFIDIPHINSLQMTDSPRFIIQVSESTKPENYNSVENKIGFFGEPIGIRIPRINYYLNLRVIDSEENGWKVVKNIASIYTYEKSNAGVLGSSVIFGVPNTKTMNFIVLLVEGDRFVVNTDKGYKYNYKITKKILSQIGDPYTVEASNFNKIVLYQDVAGNKSRLIVEAEYVSVEEDVK